MTEMYPKQDTITVQEWEAEARRRFGDDVYKWRFVCPSCKGVYSVQDWKDAGAPESMVAFSCVGRSKDGVDENTFTGNGKRCHYAGGGLFRLNPVRVLFPGGAIRETFAFADEPAVPTPEQLQQEVIDRNGH